MASPQGNRKGNKKSPAGAFLSPRRSLVVFLVPTSAKNPIVAENVNLAVLGKTSFKPHFLVKKKPQTKFVYCALGNSGGIVDFDFP
jgi:hypothetical protein